MTVKTSATADIQASAPMQIKSDAQIEIKSTQVSVSGDAMTTVKGGTVMIN
jgi:hypothetical protein